MNYETFTQSVRGSSHIRKDIPREDYGIKLSEDGIRVFAVADGHGDSRCCRAHIGSKLICEIAASEMKEFALTIQKESWTDKLFDNGERKKLIETLVTSIIGKWCNATNEEFEHNPLSDDELAAASGLNVDFSAGIGVEKLYGTTLIAGLATDKYLLLLQQGDGRCDVFGGDGAVSQPIPWDERCVGTGTTSVCDNDAIQSTRYHIIDLAKTPVIACIAGTDGVEDSFPMSMERVHAYYRDIIIYACNEGIEKLECYLETELSELSKNGSADDVTVSGIVDIEACMPFLKHFEDENDLVNISEDIKTVNVKIASVEDGGKYAHFQKLYDDAVFKFERTKERLATAAEEYKSLKESLEAQESYGATQAEPALMTKIQKLILPKKSLELLKADLAKKREQALKLKEEYDEAEKEKNKAEADFAPLKEKYEGLLKLREEKEILLDVRKKEIASESVKEPSPSAEENASENVEAGSEPVDDTNVSDNVMEDASEESNPGTE